MKYYLFHPFKPKPSSQVLRIAYSDELHLLEPTLKTIGPLLFGRRCAKTKYERVGRHSSLQIESFWYTYDDILLI